MSTSLAAMTADEIADRDKNVQIVKRGEKTFLEVGHALAELRDKRQYRDTDKTFKAFLKREFGYGPSYAYGLIDAFSTVSQMSATADKPANEGQARELAKAPPEKRPEVMKAADRIAKDEDKPVTAVHVRRAREEVTGDTNGHKPAKPPEEKPSPTNPWDEHNATIDEAVKLLKSSNAAMRDGFKVEGQELTSKYAKRLSWSGTLGMVNGLIRNLEGDGRVVDVSGGHVVTVNDAKKREAMEAKK